MMDEGRRGFLKFAGLTVLGLAGADAFEVVSGMAEASQETTTGSGTTKRWAMVLDPSKCLEHAECTDCIQACDKAHNVPVIDNPKHEVKWIWEASFADAFPEEETPYVDEKLTSGHVLVFCNHCDNPPCVRVCPTQATWRRDDGIVMMDWHRCIGCRYCAAACPYGSRSFNWEDPRRYLKDPDPSFPTRTKGVIEKCTFCEERLDRKEKPACVEACHDNALVFGDMNDPSSEVRQALRGRYALRRKPSLGTRPSVYYLV